MRRKVEPFGIKGLHIDRFRALKDVEIPLGQYITVIAGQNGTLKSTLLGMIGQPFGLRTSKTVFDGTFSTKFTDIFNMSPNYDNPGEHLYYVDFADEAIPGNQGQHLQVKSYARPASDRSHIRIVTGKTRGKNEGNIDYPVIYLGLRRTYPVGEFTNPKSTAANLSDEEIAEFKKWYSRVIIEPNESLDPVRMSRRGQKETFLVNTDRYDYLANSAGQDNLGQIIGTLISFERLREELGDSYRGGLLLIDEFDATLFPSSQTRLLDLVYEVAPSLRLQVVFTTHSMTLIEHALSMTKPEGLVNVVYLTKRESGIRCSLNPPMDEIEADLMIEPLPAKKEFKVELWCEDDEARWFLLKTLTSRLKNKCSVIPAKLSCGELGELSIRENIPSLRYVLFVVDADSNRDASKKVRESKRRFVLPGNGKSPEESVYDMLAGMSDDDVFWENDKKYTKQVFLRRYADGKRLFETSGGKHKRRYSKEWFKQEKRDGMWGNNGVRVATLWQSRHEREIQDFCEHLERRVDAMLRRYEYDNREDGR